MGNSQTVPVDRIRIFKRDGYPVAEFKTNVARSWVIGGEGRAQFDYPTRKRDVVNDDVIQFGNWLLIENTHLPPWVGVIDYPRTWSTRNVTVSAYTPERVYNQRIGPLEFVMSGSPGSIFAKLTNFLNQAERTVIRTGSVWKGGTQTQVTVNPSPLGEYLKTLWETSGEDYEWSPKTDAEGRLVVRGMWLQTLGVDTTALLHEGKDGGNIEASGRVLVEDGPIVNRVLTYGDGETWKSKPTVEVSSNPSIGRFGLREASQEDSGVTSTSVLFKHARQFITEFKNPARSFTLNALHVGDTFKYLRLGNILTVQFQNAGFRGGSIGFVSRVRIIGMSYDPKTKNKVQLVAREVLT